MLYPLSMQRDRLPYLIIPLAALLATLPLLLQGCSCGHDLDFHLLSWQEAARQFAHGNLHPRWAFTPAYGAGEPRFIFYPPLSWTLGALLTLAAAHLQPLLANLPGLHRLTPKQAFAQTPAAFTFLALTAAGLAMLRLARRHTSPALATLAATVYLANPYTLFTAYERTAYAELLAAALFPLLLAGLLPWSETFLIPREPLIKALLFFLPFRAQRGTCFLSGPTEIRRLDQNLPGSARIPSSNAAGLTQARPSETASLARWDWRSEVQRLQPTRRPILALALPLALLWLTNAPAAVIGSYTLAFLVLIRLLPLLRSRATRPAAKALAARALAATALALSLAAFYIVPAVYERPWVQIRMAVLPGLRPDDNTLFHLTPDAGHDLVLHTASTLAVLFLAVSFAALAATLLRHRGQGRAHALQLAQHLSHNPDLQNPDPKPGICVPALLALTTLAIAFLLTPASLPLWHHLPELAFLQFPWRLLALLAPIAVLALALSLPKFHLRALPQAAFALLLPAALIAPAFHTFHQPCDPEDTPQARYDLFHSPAGDDPTDEYTPIAADNDSLRPNNPPFRLLPNTLLDDTPPSPAELPGPAPTSLNFVLQTPAKLVLNLREYPLWRVENEGKIDPDRSPRADGLLTIPLPTGPVHLTITAATPAPELAADALSAVALCVSTALFFVKRNKRRT